MNLKTMNKTTRSNFITYAMVIVAFVVVQAMASTGGISSSLKGQLVPICAYIVMAISLNLTVGVLGELSLGHAGFMSVGAFSGVIAAIYFGQTIENTAVVMILAMAVGGFFAAVVGVLVGVPVLRLSGDYLAIVTLAFGEIIKGIVNNLYVGMDANGLHFCMIKNTLEMEGGKMLLNGPMGLTGIPRIATFTMGFVLIMVCLIVIFNLVNSKSGRAIMALRDNKIAAQSVGINVTSYKLMAFVISAAMAGMAGVLFATNFSTVVASKFDINTSILVLVFVVLGGLGNMRGSIIAATVLTVLPEVLREFSEYRMLVYAIVLIVMMLATNNPTLKNAISNFTGKFKRNSGKGEKVNG
ncbi:MAG: branched-chain amino acid ABC transporter permease [Peptococcaceae bacterium]|jgi:branched-chain amino acid transport system permease protein|nr:branched-chain amino acid ABC transporter permease [Peptococcaceae bacterium]MBQ2013848.1 branched-chain amino acid ABC transporter permease [Peptococcaceae bacterium]MBQ5652293.1 branched-chain amino acid ABC transporter permease [Peptococcaceae bacterium]MBQ5857492.1 branched-chain amino acid ABC transporter permease [Peptococcaceae bacterium]